jgi:hypothetical protein
MVSIVSTSAAVVLVVVMVVSFVVLLHLLQRLTSGDVPLVPLKRAR